MVYLCWIWKKQRKNANKKDRKKNLFLNGTGGDVYKRQEYPVEVSYEGQEVQIVHREVTVKETVKKQAFQLIKISEDEMCIRDRSSDVSED